MNRSTLKEKYELTQVLDKGFVRFVDCLGDDYRIEDCARISYAGQRRSDKQSKALIRYLVANEHHSPLEHAVLSLIIKAPIFVMRQWMRHRTFSYNEISARYTTLDDDRYIPSPERLATQSTDNKQCSTDTPLPESQQHFFYEKSEALHEAYHETYQTMDNWGLSREVNRINMPVGTYTTVYMTANLRSWLHFIKLRNHPHAQKEIQVYAEVVESIIKDWCPFVYEAFSEYIQNKITLSPKAFAYFVFALEKKPTREETQQSIQKLEIPKSEKAYLQNLLEGLLEERKTPI